MLAHLAIAVCVNLLLTLAAFAQAEAVSSESAGLDAKVQALIEEGAYAEAEKLLTDAVPDPSAPATSEPAIQLEILRRTRYDFPHDGKEILSQIQASIPDATQADVDRWRAAGDLGHRVIDGEIRYFRQAAGNLFRFNEEASRRRTNGRARKKFDVTALVEQLVEMSETADGPEIYPVKHRVRYELSVNEGHDRLKPGAIVRAWLPFPQEYRQQRDVKLVSSVPPEATVAKNGMPQRTVYFEETVADPQQPPRFRVEFEFVTSAYCPQLDAAKVEPYDESSAFYRQYTAERLPHIAFTPEVTRLAREIVGHQNNPLEKARRVFRWVSQNVPWCSEMEYSIIPSLSAKGLAARRGDCGVQGMTFITLCRAAGVPARWQSGWQTKPNDWNMHDWSEFYVEPWGWLPADASYGLVDHDDPRVRDFFCGHMDP